MQPWGNEKRPGVALRYARAYLRGEDKRAVDRLRTRDRNAQDGGNAIGAE